MKLTRFKLALATLLMVMGPAVATTEKQSHLEDQTGVAVTIYNENLALIKDTRKIRLDKGESTLALRDVSALIRPETALLRSLTQPDGLSIIEQNFDFDLLTPQKLLQKYVGKHVRIVKTHPTTGEETIESARVLSANNGVVIQIGDRIETGYPGRIIYDKIPENLRDRPTLVMQLDNPIEKEQTLELSYLTGGLSWKADYVAELNSDDSLLDLNGWVTLTNASGTQYTNALLQLVAGDVNRVSQNAEYDLGIQKSLMRESKAKSSMTEESLFEYHMYSLGRPTTLRNNQTKQVALLNATSVSVNKEYLLKGADYYYHSQYGEIGKKLKVGVYVDFTNNKKSALGLPLPKGTVRVYKKDSKGNAQFVGEDAIDHTPKNEDVKLKLGDAFDVTAHKKQTSFKKRSSILNYNYVYDIAFEIKLKNAKKQDVTVKVHEPIPGDWTMKKSSHKHNKVAAGTAEWQVKVPAEGSVTLKYVVNVKY